MTLEYEDEIDPETADWGEETHKTAAVAILGVLAKGYVKGKAAALYELGHDAAGITLSAADIAHMQATADAILEPIKDYNLAFAQALKEKTKELIAQGKTTEEIKQYYLNNIPSLLKELPVKIQRPGKQAITFTPDGYAKNLANTVPYAIRNEAWKKTMQDGGEEEWESICYDDEKTCPECWERCGQIYSMDDDMPPYHGFCRCHPKKVEKPAEAGPAWGEE